MASIPSLLTLAMPACYLEISHEFPYDCQNQQAVIYASGRRIVSHFL